MASPDALKIELDRIKSLLLTPQAFLNSLAIKVEFTFKDISFVKTGPTYVLRYRFNEAVNPIPIDNLSVRGIIAAGEQINLFVDEYILYLNQLLERAKKVQ